MRLIKLKEERGKEVGEVFNYSSIPTHGISPSSSFTPFLCLIFISYFYPSQEREGERGRA